MSSYKTEDEQLEFLKKSWEKYGSSVITGILLCVLIIYGYRFWQDRNLKITYEASGIYQDLVDAMEDKKRDADVVAYIKTLEEQYSHTPYAVIAALDGAKRAVVARDYKQAIESLHWAQRHNKDKELQVIIDLRLARVLAQNQQFDDALTTLNPIHNDTFAASILELKGDVLVSKQMLPEAKKAYQEAILRNTNQEARQLVEIKLNSLEGRVAQGDKQ